MTTPIHLPSSPWNKIMIGVGILSIAAIFLGIFAIHSNTWKGIALWGGVGLIVVDVIAYFVKRRYDGREKDWVAVQTKEGKYIWKEFEDIVPPAEEFPDRTFFVYWGRCGTERGIRVAWKENGAVINIPYASITKENGPGKGFSQSYEKVVKHQRSYLHQKMIEMELRPTIRPVKSLEEAQELGLRLEKNEFLPCQIALAPGVDVIVYISRNGIYYKKDDIPQLLRPVSADQLSQREERKDHDETSLTKIKLEPSSLLEPRMTTNLLTYLNDDEYVQLGRNYAHRYRGKIVYDLHLPDDKKQVFINVLAHNLIENVKEMERIEDGLSLNNPAFGVRHVPFDSDEIRKMQTHEMVRANFSFTDPTKTTLGVLCKVEGCFLFFPSEEEALFHNPNFRAVSIEALSNRETITNIRIKGRGPLVMGS